MQPLRDAHLPVRLRRPIGTVLHGAVRRCALWSMIAGAFGGEAAGIRESGESVAWLTYELEPRALHNPLPHSTQRGSTPSPGVGPGGSAHLPHNTGRAHMRSKHPYMPLIDPPPHMRSQAP
eukprot:281101-Chlamydomonas_euryale.AAC.1